MGWRAIYPGSISCLLIFMVTQRCWEKQRRANCTIVFSLQREILKSDLIICSVAAVLSFAISASTVFLSLRVCTIQIYPLSTSLFPLITEPVVELRGTDRTVEPEQESQVSLERFRKRIHVLLRVMSKMLFGLHHRWGSGASLFLCPHLGSCFVCKNNSPSRGIRLEEGQ